MFTPQRTSLFPITPRGRGKGPPNGNMEVDGLMESLDDWRGFKDAGMLDQGELFRRDMEAQNQRILSLERELHDYQHTMGLLLIEKQEWTAKCEELRRALSEAHEMLKREQAAHLISMDEVEKREKKLRKSMNVEEERIADLERALRTTSAEYEHIKFTSSNTLAEATALEAGILDRSIEVQEKLHAADAKLAEANRKSLELERRLQEIESRENVLRKERLSFNAERESHDTTLRRHKEDLLQWERKLQEREESLCDSRRAINLGEEKANMVDQILKEKDKELKEKQKFIELNRLPLHHKEEDLHSRALELDLQEKNIASARVNLEAKEKQLNLLKENLISREQVEIQKILNEYQIDLNSKKYEFELELERKRKNVDGEMRLKVNDLERRDIEISDMKVKLQKQEQALLRKSDEYKVREKEIKIQSQLLKERENSLKSEEKRLELEKKDMVLEKESLKVREVDLEKLSADISQKMQVNVEESENLKVTERERAEHISLQMDLKQKIESARQQQELFLKEGETLKQDRLKFEEKWEELDEKKDAVAQEMQKLNKEKEMFEKVKNDLKQLKHDYEARKRELEINMEIKQHEMELNMQERERAFEKEKEAQLSDINKLKLSVVNEVGETNLQKLQLKEETEKIVSRKRQLEVQQNEMQKDINELFSLSEKVNNQRELFMKERSQFLSFVERLKNCESCSRVVSSYAISDKILAETKDTEISPFPVLGYDLKDKFASYASSSKRSTETDLKSMQMEPRSSHSRSVILRLVKCASELLKSSPIGKIQHEPIDNLTSEEHKSECPVISLEATLNTVGEENVKPSFQIVDRSIDVREVGVGGIKEAINDQSNHVDNEIEDGQEYSEQLKLRRSQRPSSSKYKKSTRSSKRNVIEDTTSISAEMSKGSQVDIEGQEHSGQSKLRRSRRLSSCKSKESKLSPKRAVTEDTTSISVEMSKGSHVDIEGTHRETKIAEKGKRTRKSSGGQGSQMTTSEIQPIDSDHSESVTTGRYRKRRKGDIPVPPNPGNRGYNLRRKKPKILDVPIYSVVNISEADAAYNVVKRAEGEVSVGEASVEMNPNNNAEAASTQLPKTASEDADRAPLVQVTTHKRFEIEEVSLHRAFESISPSDGIDEYSDQVKLKKSGSNEDRINTPVHDVEDESYSILPSDDDDDDDGNYHDSDPSDEDDDCGRVSVGKKLWTFFTS